MTININSVYIPSIDGKDLYITNNLVNCEQGYNLKKRTGEYNLKKFINTFDCSLDIIKLQSVYKSVYRKKDFSFILGDHEYSTQVINVTFNFNVKEYNMYYGNTYVKFGYDINSLEFKDCLCFIDNELIGIEVESEVLNPCLPEKLTKFFYYKNSQYHAKTNITTRLTSSQIREQLYVNGFVCNGIHYVRFKRSSGSARVGKCLFVNKDLYEKFHKWELCGLDIQEGQELDLAAFEGYISLTTSSIIDILEIDPKSILVIEDYSSIFKDDVVVTKVENKSLVSTEENVEIENKIWDGQTLIDPSALQGYKDKGMVLLRNRLFKSCCFNTEIQKWFKDNNITEISQLNGITLAKNISDIKMITTPSSIKYAKFGSILQWLKIVEPEFGLVKYEKPTNYFDGRLVSTHYQLINTLQFTSEEVELLLKDSFEFIKLLRTEPAVVRHYIKYVEDKEIDEIPMISNNDIVFNLMGLNNKFCQTKYYNCFLDNLILSFIKGIKRGHILVNGNYSVMVGNPIEMLQYSIKQFDGISIIGKGNVSTKRFEYNRTILGSRSPHVCAGNVLLTTNVQNDLLDKYMNLTNEIICINSIGENILSRLSGADFDSDTIMITDNDLLIKVAQRNYQYFKVPTSAVQAKKTKRYYTPEHQADLDIQTSVNKIGEIINMSQVLNSLYWDNLSNGQTHDQNKDLYLDICTLDIMSGIEIDKAKKEFVINNVKELAKIRLKYKKILTEEKSGKAILPYFFAHLARLKGYYNSVKKEYTKFNTSMDYVQVSVNSFKFRSLKKKVLIPFVDILDSKKFHSSHVCETKVNNILSSIRIYNRKRKEIWTSSLTTEEKIDLHQKQKEKCISIIDRNFIGFSNIYKLLSTIDKSEDVVSQNIIMSILFKTANNNFYSAIEESKEDTEIIEQNDSGNINLFGLYYQKKARKNQETPVVVKTH